MEKSNEFIIFNILFYLEVTAMSIVLLILFILKNNKKTGMRRGVEWKIERPRGDLCL